MIRVALKGLPARKLRAVADRDRDRARRRDDQRHLRPHRHDQRRVQRRSSRRSTRTPTRSSPARPPSANDNGQRRAGAELRPVAARARCAALPDVGRGRGSSPTTRRSSSAATARSISSAARRTSRFSVDPDGDQRFNPLKLVGGQLAERPERDRDRRRNVASSKDYKVGDTIGVQSERPGRRSSAIAGIVKLSGGARSAARRSPVFDLPTAQKLFQRGGKLDLIRVAGEARRADAAAARARSSRSCPPTAQVRDAARRRRRRTRRTQRLPRASSSTSCSPSAASRSSSAAS